VLHLGKVLVSGTPDDVRGSIEVQKAYLGTGRREDLFLTDGGTSPARRDGPAPLDATAEPS
jgi:hypothetical protein